MPTKVNTSLSIDSDPFLDYIPNKNSTFLLAWNSNSVSPAYVSASNVPHNSILKLNPSKMNCRSQLYSCGFSFQTQQDNFVSVLWSSIASQARWLKLLSFLLLLCYSTSNKSINYQIIKIINVLLIYQYFVTTTICKWNFRFW